VFEYTRCKIFRGNYYDTDHYSVVADVRKILAICIQAEQKFCVEIFNLRNLNELEEISY
jgi:hypothetical protein